jgi:hypothetical protein
LYAIFILSPGQTVKIEIEFSPPFRTAYSATRLLLDLEGGEQTVPGLLRRLAEEYGEPMKTLLWEREGSIKSGLMVMVNERIYTGTALNQHTVELRNHDQVSLLYYLSGG